jgi:hypothetical protein
MIFNLFKRKDTRTPEEIKEQLAIDYRLTFGTEAGQRVLSDLIKALHFFEPSYVGGDSGETDFREGERNALLYILSRVQLPDEKDNLIKEVIENA